jgi:hypothetical protein
MTTSHSCLNLRRRTARFVGMVFSALRAIAASAQAPPYALFQYSTLTSSTNTIRVSILSISLRKIVRFAALCLAFAAPCSTLRAQEASAVEEAAAAATTPYAEAQYSTLTGANNQIRATLLPVVTSSGVSYKDVTIDFSVSSSGIVTVASGYPQVTRVTLPSTSTFKAGNYVGPSTLYSGQFAVTVSSAGVAPGGTEWSLRASSGANVCTWPASATWYVGPITSNPWYSRLHKAGITSTAYSYGIVGSVVGSSFCSDFWATGVLIGVAQTGNTLTIVSFSDGSTDYSTPKDQITYTFKSTTAAGAATAPILEPGTLNPIAAGLSAAATTTPVAQFQLATITGSGNSINVSNLPVVTSSGSTFQNLTILFDVSSSGGLTLAGGYPQVVASPVPQVNTFLAGNYQGPSTLYTGNFQVSLTGPGVAPGGAMEWSLAASPSTNICTWPVGATWYVGPITSNPLYPRLQKAGITSTAYSYGIVGSVVGSSFCSDFWATGVLIGVAQTGNTLTIVSFSDGSTDYSTPKDQITYTLIP